MNARTDWRAQLFRLDQVSDSNPDKLAANHIRNLILKSVCPILKQLRSPMDSADDYKNEFGSIGET